MSSSAPATHPTTRLRTAWVLAALLAAPLPAIAAKPPEVQWLKTFAGMGKAYGWSVRQTADGGFIAAGTTGPDSTDGLDYYYVVRLDSNGETLWTRMLGWTTGGSKVAIAFSVLQTPDGGFAVYGYGHGDGRAERSYLAKLDSVGSIQWQSTPSIDTMEFGSSILSTADGGFVLAGMKQVKSTYMKKVDSAGRRLWSWHVDEDARSCWPMFVPVAPTGGGGYVTTGHNDSFGLTLWEVDDRGTTLWRRVYSDEHAYDGQGLVLTADRGFAVAGLAGRRKDDRPGRVYLLKVRADGAKQWCKYYGDYHYWGCSSIQQTRDSGFVIAGTLEKQDFHFNTFVLRTDPDGNEIWHTALAPSTEEEGGCVQQTSDGGYVVCGSTRSQGKSRLYMAKLAPDRTR